MVYQNPKSKFWGEPLERHSRENRQLKLDSIFVLGDGSIISFREDIWCGEGPLYETFPTSYSLAATKRAKVAEVWDNSRGGRGLDSHFVRPLNEWKLKKVQIFF